PVRVADGRFRVIGLMEEKGRSLGFDLDDLVFIPVTTAQDLFALDSLSQIITAARTKADAPAAAEEIEEILARRRNGERTFTIQSQDDLLKTFATLTKAMTFMLLAIASISLIVGGIGIMNIMLVSVTERTREIGIRLAIGARGSDVLTQFLVESIVMGILGGVVGLAIGVIGSKILGHFTGWETVISPIIMVIAVGFSGAVGVFFGYYPARKAAALNPIEALRYE
ncbi:MAG: ABC transporter permease, partial [Thermoanaerobaculia bacterium]